MFNDDELLPISALQHLAFCERQCALIHIEGAWAENMLTAQGRVMHERSDEPSHETRGEIRTARALRIRSLRLGISGIADVVEFCGNVPFPVEYKRGKPKPDHCDWVQLCAQAFCLEEMLSVTVPRGAMFYGQPRRRQEVEFDSALRAETEQLCLRLHELFQRAETPPACFDARCEKCSLMAQCLPKATGRNSARYLADLLHSAREDMK